MTSVLTSGSASERAALDYAARDWLVMPATGKRPHALAPHGLKSASADPDIIRAWYRQHPDANVAIICRPSGLLAIDVDDRHDGPDALHELERRLGDLPLTPRSLTGGGFHVFVRNPQLATAASLGPGIDVRDRAYVIAPPSRHSSGRMYAWEVEPDEVPLAELPDPWRELLTRKPRDLTYREEGNIPQGRRNDTLTRRAGSMRRAGFDAAAIEAALLVTNETYCRPPLPAGEARAIAKSIGRKPTAPRFALDPVRWAADLGVELTATEHHILVVLASGARDDGLVIGGEWIWKRAGCDKHRVYRAVDGLEAKGVISVRRGRGMKRPNLYQFL